MWQCSYCAKKYKYESEKNRHEQSHFPHFECKVCAKKFSFRSALLRHEKQHERKEAVQCSKCGGQFRDEALLKRHIQYAHKGTFTCEKCSAQFRSEAAMNNHMKIHQPESERKFRCTYSGCTKSFNFSHHLKHHMLAHTDDKQHFCCHCGKGFIQPHHLKAHIKTHQPDEWLPCTVADCHKVFTNEYARKRHIATHRNKCIDISGTASDCSTTFEVTIEEAELCACCGELVTNEHSLAHSNTCSMKEQSEPEDLSVASLGISINEISDDMERDIKRIHKVNEDVINDKDVYNNVVSMKEVLTTSPINITLNIQPYTSQCWARENNENNIDNEEIHKYKDESIMDEVPKEVDKVKSKVNSTHCWARVSPMQEAPPRESSLDSAAKVSPKSCKCKELLNDSMESDYQEYCFCEQITRNNFTEATSENDINNLQLIKLSDEFKTGDYLSTYQYNSNKCVGCECSNLCSDEDKAKEVCKDSVPLLEFHTNGVVKIKEMLDIDIAKSIDNNETKINNNVNTSQCWARSPWMQEGLGHAPPRGPKNITIESNNETEELSDIKSHLNTCEDVLGKCIMTSTGNMEDECLCAKMIADNQQMIAQEIEELTPCPKKNTWFNIKYKVRV